MYYFGVVDGQRSLGIRLQIKREFGFRSKNIGTSIFRHNNHISKKSSMHLCMKGKGSINNYSQNRILGMMI